MNDLTTSVDFLSRFLREERFDVLHRVIDILQYTFLRKKHNITDWDTDLDQYCYEFDGKSLLKTLEQEGIHFDFKGKRVWADEIKDNYCMIVTDDGKNFSVEWFNKVLEKVE